MATLYQIAFVWIVILCHMNITYSQSVCTSPTIINSTGHFYITSISGTFQGSTIYCGSLLNKCVIKCYGVDFCKNTYIECHSKECILDCGTNTACQYLNYHSYYADYTSIRCYGDRTCLGANMQIVAQDNISPLTKSLDVHCERPRACDSSTWRINAVTDVTITCALYVLTCVTSKWYIDGGNNDLNYYMSCRGCGWSDVYLSGGSLTSQANIQCFAVHHTQLTGSCGLQQVYCDLASNICTVDCTTQAWNSCNNNNMGRPGTIYCRNGQGTTCTTNWELGYPYGAFTNYPTIDPTFDAPTPQIPTLCPTMEPTPNPTSIPSNSPTKVPTKSPTT
eukprot:422096_1